ncbi:VanZ family protein [Desulfoluna sp.]|uniref:VanZ family protein n=1 Tax=Desulfoluna sp. TaxID=2045199 RepID=UPI00261FED85|nr:VanZ family protein [Desulfoluna sp.]
MGVLGSKVFRSWLAVFLLCVLIFLPSLMHLPMPRGPYYDKVLHLLVYTAAGFFVLRGARSLPLGQHRLAAISFAFLLAALIGMADEVIQLFVPNRFMDRVDFLFDLAGIVCGIALYLVLWGREERKLRGRSPLRRP